MPRFEIKVFEQQAEQANSSNGLNTLFLQSKNWHCNLIKLIITRMVINLITMPVINYHANFA